MPRKKPDKRIEHRIRGWPVIIEFYDSVIIVKDESGNMIRISIKKDNFLLNLDGGFTSDILCNLKVAGSPPP